LNSDLRGFDLPLIPVRVHECCQQVHIKVVESLADSIVAIPFLATSSEHAQMGHLKVKNFNKDKLRKEKETIHHVQMGKIE